MFVIIHERRLEKIKKLWRWKKRFCEILGTYGIYVSLFIYYILS